MSLEKILLVRITKAIYLWSLLFKCLKLESSFGKKKKKNKAF